MCWADQFERDRLRIRVRSTNITGTLVGINLDNRSFDVDEPDRLQVRLNDRLMTRTRDLTIQRDRYSAVMVDRTG
ncbi:MAG: hypothetical protein QMD80_03255 [archaeon]|nr:hypothetical protein [archaeon]